MKKLIFAMSAVLATAWLLVACSGSNNSNTNGNCAAGTYYGNGYNPSVYPNGYSPYGNGYNNGYYNNGYNNPYYNNAANPCLNGVTGYANPNGNYPYNGICPSGTMPLFSQSTGTSYCAPMSSYSYYYPYSTPTYYQGYMWYYIY